MTMMDIEQNPINALSTWLNICYNLAYLADIFAILDRMNP